MKTSQTQKVSAMFSLQCSKKFFCHVYGHCAVSHSRNHLPQNLGSYITHSINPREIGFRGFPGKDVSAVIQLQLANDQFRGRFAPNADENTVAGNIPFLTVCPAADADTVHFFVGKQL